MWAIQCIAVALFNSVNMPKNMTPRGRVGQKRVLFFSLTNNPLLKESSPSQWFGSMAQMLTIQRTEFPCPYNITKKKICEFNINNFSYHNLKIVLKLISKQGIQRIKSMLWELVCPVHSLALSIHLLTTYWFKCDSIKTKRMQSVLTNFSFQLSWFPMLNL